MNKKLDERQLTNRYKIGFQSFILLLMLLIADVFVQDVFGFKWASHFTGTMIFFYILLTFFSVRCIFTDSYFAERDLHSLGVVMFAFIFGGVASTISIIVGAACGRFSFIENHQLSDKSLIVFVTLWMLSIPLCYFLKKRHEKKKNMCEQKEEL